MSTIKGVTRTLDDWTTTFHLALVVLPGRPEASQFLPIGRRIIEVLGGSDARPAFLIYGNERNARRVLGGWADQYLTFLDVEGTVVRGLGISRVPAFVHIRNDLSVASLVDGWDPDAWNDAVELLAKEMSWSKPLIPAPGDPRPYAGWRI
jgi:hypothetical protein